MKLVSILIAVVGLAACASFVPTDERTIELPTQKYRQPVEPALTAKQAILKVKESCDRYGRFIVDGEAYVCHLRSK